MKNFGIVARSPVFETLVSWSPPQKYMWYSGSYFQELCHNYYADYYCIIIALKLTLPATYMYIRLFQTYRLWLEEPRLHTAELYLRALPPQYEADKLAAVFKHDPVSCSVGYYFRASGSSSVIQSTLVLLNTSVENLTGCTKASSIYYLGNQWHVHTSATMLKLLVII